MPLTTTINTADVTSDSQGIAVRSYGMTEYARRFITGQDMPMSGTSTRGPSQPYAQSIWVYICIKLLSELAASLPLVLTNKNADIVEAGKAYDFWHTTISGNWSLKELVRQTVGWKALTGEVHWLLDGSRYAVNRISAVVGKPALEIKLNAAETEVLAWKLKLPKGGTVPIALDEIVSDIMWSPYEKFRGLGPLTAAALSVAQDWQASNFNNERLGHNAEPGGLLYEDTKAGSDGMIDETQARQIESRWNSRHQGASKAGRISVLYGGVKWQSVSSTYREMQFADLKKMSREEIIAAFSTPKVLLGLAEDANYGYADAEIEIFWNNAMRVWVSDLDAMFQQVTDRIEPNLKANLDIKTAPAYAKLYAKKIEQAKEIMDLGATLNDVNEQLDLGLTPSEWGKEWWVSRNRVPATDILNGLVAPAGVAALQVPQKEAGIFVSDPFTGEPKEQPKLIEDKIKAIENKTAIWKAWVKSWGPLERQYRNRLRSHFYKMEQAVLGKVGGLLVPNPTLASAGIQLLDLRPKAAAAIEIGNLWDDRRAEDDRLRKATKKHYNKAAELGLRQGAVEGGADVSIIGGVDPVMEAMKRRKIVKVVEINETVRKSIEKKIHAALSDSGAAGENLTDLTTRIKGSIEESFNQTRNRALTIARTETAQVVNTGRHRGMQKAQVKTKRWVAAGGNVRPSHVAADARYGTDEKAIALDLMFEVGGAMLRHPGDPNGPPGEIINCRCLALAGKLADETILSIEDCLEKGFISWT